MFKKIGFFSMLLFLMGGVGFTVVDLEAKEKKPMPPPELSMLIYDLHEMEDAIDTKDWDAFFREVNEYREFFTRAKPAFTEMGLKSTSNQFGLCIGLLQKSGLAKDVKGCRKNFILLSRYANELKEEFANVPDEVGVLKVWIEEVEEAASENEWDEVYEELEEEDLAEIVEELEEELEEIGEDDEAELFEQNLASLKEAIAKKDEDQVKILVKNIDGNLDEFGEVFALKRTEARAIDFMKNQLEEAEEYLEKGVWERTIHEIKETSAYTDELLEEIPAAQVKPVEETMAELIKAAKEKNKVLTEQKIAELVKLLDSLENYNTN